MARYAEGTTVKVENSVAELRRVVLRYGGHSLTLMEDDDTPAVAVLFRISERWVRFGQALPPPPRKPEGRSRRDAEIRRRWRVLILKVKTRLEEFAGGESTFEETLLPFVVLPDNRTVAEALGPQVEEMYRNGSMPRMLDGPKGPPP